MKKEEVKKKVHKPFLFLCLLVASTVSADKITRYASQENKISKACFQDAVQDECVKNGEPMAVRKGLLKCLIGAKKRGASISESCTDSIRQLASTK